MNYYVSDSTNYITIEGEIVKFVITLSLVLSHCCVAVSKHVSLTPLHAVITHHRVSRSLVSFVSFSIGKLY